MEKTITNAELFKELISFTKKNNYFKKVEEILEYVLPESLVEEILTIDDIYDFSFNAKIDWGSSEGIYITCYLEKTNKRIYMGTVKTLLTSIEGFKIMGEFAGILTYCFRMLY